MRSDMTREYRLDDLLLQVPLHYDESLGRYLEQIPDFEKDPIYTAAGRPVVCAAQDACSHNESLGNYRCVDCGDCLYFESAQSETLIGICSSPDRRKEIDTERKDSR